MGYRDYSTAKGHIVDATGHGDFTTISAALAASVAGETIFVRPGTYTENPTGIVGVNICAYITDSVNGNVTLSGKFTFSGAGEVTVSGIRFQTNGDFAIAVTGSVASALYLDGCYLNCTNNTGISFTSSSANSSIEIFNCLGNLGTTGIALWDQSCPGIIGILDTNLFNSGASTTISNNSAGEVLIYNSVIDAPLGTTGSGTLGITYTIIDTSVINTISTTINGTNPSSFMFSHFVSGTASSITIGTGAQATVVNTIIGSNNTDAITGLGTVNAGIVTFTGTSSTINTSTVNKLTTFGGTIV